MSLDADLSRLVASLSPAKGADMRALREAGGVLDYRWPADYERLMSMRNGGEGRIGRWYVQLWPVADLVQLNRLDRDDEAAVVAFGGDGGGEIFAFERGTGAVWLIPVIGERRDWIFLGATITEAFQRFERDDVYEDAPGVPRGTT